MIKQNELRVGNLVMDFDDGQKYYPIESIYVNLHGVYWVSYRDNSIKCSVEELEPIPLTEELLLSSRFRRLDKYTFTYKGFFIHMRKRGFVYGKNLIVEYYHQLQNLFFILKQEELKLDQI